MMTGTLKVWIKIIALKKSLPAGFRRSFHTAKMPQVKTEANRS